MKILSIDRQKGQDLFASGDYLGASKVYTRAIDECDKDDDAEISLLYGDLAECFFKLGDLKSAEGFCESSLDRDPCNVTSHFRLARISSPESHAAAISICCTIALYKGDIVPADVSLVYEGIQSLHQEWMPTDYRHVVLSESNGQISYRATCFVIVFPPGLHSAPYLNQKQATVSFIGMGMSTLKSYQGHVVWANYDDIKSLYLSNLNLIGDGGGFAAIGVSDDAFLNMRGCKIIDNANGGIVICGAHAKLENCSFERCSHMAIEVREGGTLDASRLYIKDCFQGIVVYGGAKSITLLSCSILDCRAEGILLHGSFVNASNVFANLKQMRYDNAASAVSEAAHQWGLKRGIQLIASVQDCIISGCKNFGISTDLGATVQLSRCKLELNLPCSLYIQGGNDVSVTACQFVFDGSRVSIQNLLMKKSCGIYVAMNYGGDVNVVGCAFAGPFCLDIIEECKNDLYLKMGSLSLKGGLWSKPIKCKENLKFLKNEISQMPSIEQLAMRIPGQLLSLKTVPDKRSKKLGDMRRLSWTDHSSFPWSHSSQFYYPIGNSAGYNVAGDLTDSEGEGNDGLVILLAACGDIRNLLATVSAVSNRSISFTLNDENLCMLARNIVLLYLALGCSFNT